MSFRKYSRGNLAIMTGRKCPHGRLLPTTESPWPLREREKLTLRRPRTRNSTNCESGFPTNTGEARLTTCGEVHMPGSFSLRGKQQKALKEMRASASADGKLDKHPVTPGDVYATHDLLGDMLMQLGKPKEALAAYEFTMGHSPNRFVSIAGAAAAAAKMGNPEVAKRYYRQLLDQVDPSSKRAELVEARKLLPKN